MHQSQRVIALPLRGNKNPNGHQIVDVLEGLVPTPHFGINAMEMFRASENFRLDVVGSKFLIKGDSDTVNLLLALLQTQRNLGLNLLVSLRIKRLQAQIFQFQLDPSDPETMGQRRIHFPRLQRDALLFLRRKKLNRAHIIQTVRQFHKDHPDIFGHRKKHLPKIFRLLNLPAMKTQFTDFRHPIHQQRQRLSELISDLTQRNLRILHHVVEQPGREGHGIEVQTGQNPGHLKAMMHEGETGLAILPPMRQGAQTIGPLDPIQIRGLVVRPNFLAQSLKFGVGLLEFRVFLGDSAHRTHLFRLRIGDFVFWIEPSLYY